MRVPHIAWKRSRARPGTGRSAVRTLGRRFAVLAAGSSLAAAGLAASLAPAAAADTGNPLGLAPAEARQLQHKVDVALAHVDGAKQIAQNKIALPEGGVVTYSTPAQPIGEGFCEGGEFCVYEDEGFTGAWAIDYFYYGTYDLSPYYSNKVSSWDNDQWGTGVGEIWDYQSGADELLESSSWYPTAHYYVGNGDNDRTDYIVLHG